MIRRISPANQVPCNSSSFGIENPINFRCKLSQNLQNLVPRPDLKHFPFLTCDELSLSKKRKVSQNRSPLSWSESSLTCKKTSWLQSFPWAREAGTWSARPDSLEHRITITWRFWISWINLSFPLQWIVAMTLTVDFKHVIPWSTQSIVASSVSNSSISKRAKKVARQRYISRYARLGCRISSYSSKRFPERWFHLDTEFAEERLHLLHSDTAMWTLGERKLPLFALALLRT